MVFPAVMYGCESWTVKKAERWRTDALELWCWRRLLKSPLDCKKIQPVHSEGDQPWDFFGRNDAKTETPVLWPPHAESWLIGKDSDAGRDWGQEEKGTTGWDGWMASLTWWTWIWVNSRRWWWTGRPGVLRFMGLQRVGHDWATELNWYRSLSGSLMIATVILPGAQNWHWTSLWRSWWPIQGDILTMNPTGHWYKG